MRHWQIDERHRGAPTGQGISAQIGAAVKLLISEPPFVGLTKLNQLICDVPTYPVRCVCIPMRNEQDQLTETCRALELALTGFETDTAVVFVSNETVDRSVAMAAGWAQARGISHVVADLALDHSISTASHSRRLAMDIGAWLAPLGRLLTTDADTLVAADWISATDAALTANGGLICGSVSIDAETEAGLPVSVRECGRIEGDYKHALTKLWDVWAGLKAPRLFVNAMGASLAISSTDYLAAGRIPTPAVAEDKALATACMLEGIPVTESTGVKVVTSGRMDARARGGMGDALLDRMHASDPECDEALVPVGVLKSRAQAWAATKTKPDRHISFANCLANDPLLTYQRMRLSDVRRELAIAQKLMRADEFPGRAALYGTAR